jgi:glucan phosphoethanolaminetransferase (alkaline phosphatase superfamily)
MAKQKTAQEYLVKSKLYRFVSILFAVLGVLVFAVLYVKNVEGRVLEALKDPMIILLFIVPFLPAVCLSFLSNSAEKKYLKMTDGGGVPTKK